MTVVAARPRSWWTRWRQPAVMVGVGGASSVLVLLCGWPFWQERPLAAIGSCAATAVFAAAATLLATGGRSRSTGRWMVAAALLWGLAWLGAWNTGVLPVVGEVCQSGFFFCTGLATLRYPNGIFQGWWDRAWVVQAFVTLLVADVVLVLGTRPEWNGFAADVWWPTVNDDIGLGHRISQATSVGYLAMAVTLCVVLGLHIPRLGAMERRLVVPVLAAVSAVGVLAAVAESRITRQTAAPDEQLVLLLWESAITVCIPFSLFGVGLRRRWREITVVGRVLGLIDVPSVATVRAALRMVLDDPALDVMVWLPDSSRYVDTSGTLRGEPDTNRSTGRWRHELRAATGVRLAMVDLADSLRIHPTLVNAALHACASVLELAQVQFSALEQVRETQQRIVRAETAERVRIERNLHDGAQQRMLALAVRLGTLAATTADPDVQRQVQQCQEELLAALADLRLLAQGIHPPVLTQQGLAAALEADAERFDGQVVLDVPPDRLPADVESTLYFALCEAVTNAVKHAAANRIAVSVWTSTGWVFGQVSDDGLGGASLGAGRGLTGLEDRVRAMRGVIELDSQTGRGTRLRIGIPCE